MELILGIVALIVVMLYVIEHIKYEKQKQSMILLTEELDRFAYSPDKPHLENLDEGYFANMYNQIAKLEMQFLDMQKEVNAREREMICFVENMAHQIKNVLTALQIQLDLLHINANSNQVYHLEKCQNSVNRLTWEIDRLLKSSQLAEGKIQMLDERMNICDVIEKVLETLSPIAEERNVSIDVNTENNIYYSGDPFWIPQAIENVIKNAIEHTQVQGKVSVEVSQFNGVVTIRVEDSGEGIPYSEMDNLFRRFNRGNSNKSGYGIGLSMAKDIAKAHHGDIRVGNNSDKGAWFEINLLCLDGSDVYRRK